MARRRSWGQQDGDAQVVTAEADRATEDKETVERANLRRGEGRGSEVSLARRRLLFVKTRTLAYSLASSAVNAPEFLSRSTKQTAMPAGARAGGGGGGGGSAQVDLPGTRTSYERGKSATHSRRR